MQNQPNSAFWRPVPQGLSANPSEGKPAGDAHEAGSGTPSAEAMLGGEVPAPSDSQHLNKVGPAHRLFQTPLADSLPDQLHRHALTSHGASPLVSIRIHLDEASILCPISLLECVSGFPCPPDPVITVGVRYRVLSTEGVSFAVHKSLRAFRFRNYKQKGPNVGAKAARGEQSLKVCGNQGLRR
jgi:hypothetical protein